MYCLLLQFFKVSKWEKDRVQTSAKLVISPYYQLSNVGHILWLISLA